RSQNLRYRVEDEAEPNVLSAFLLNQYSVQSEPLDRVAVERYRLAPGRECGYCCVARELLGDKVVADRRAGYDFSNFYQPIVVNEMMKGLVLRIHAAKLPKIYFRK